MDRELDLRQPHSEGSIRITVKIVSVRDLRRGGATGRLHGDVAVQSSKMPGQQNAHPRGRSFEANKHVVEPTCSVQVIARDVVCRAYGGADRLSFTRTSVRLDQLRSVSPAGKRLGAKPNQLTHTQLLSSNYGNFEAVLANAECRCSSLRNTEAGCTMHITQLPA